MGSLPQRETPNIVDDCLTTHRLELLNKGIKKLSPYEIYDCLPMLLPQTHHLSVDGFEMQGIAKYPIDVWIEEKRPVMTRMMWILFMKKIASKDMEHIVDIWMAMDDVERNGLLSTS